MKKRQRLDVLITELGLAPSRERARAFILAGQVRVAGQVVSKAGASVDLEATVTVDAPDHPYVSRGGLKLAHALDTFAIDVSGDLGLDIGASTGGFTDVLLQRGARRVVALDVGHGQLDWKLRSDPRVDVLERINARQLTPGDLPPAARTFDIITIDVSFISLRLVLPVVPPLLESDGDVIALVKPQFEAGRAEVGKGGIVRDDDVRRRVVADVAAAASALGLNPSGTVESPIQGMEGNREFLMHLRLTPGLARAGDMGRINRVGLIAKHHLDAAAGVLVQLATWLDAHGVEPVFETETAALTRQPTVRPTVTRDELPYACDLVLVLGGDGTFIGMAGRIAKSGTDVPILGVNFGSLGFLTEVTLDELYESLEAVLDGQAHMETRMMLCARTCRQGASLEDRYVLNDVVITKGALSRIIDLSVAIGGQPVMRVRADGLIVATPTGSSAYNLAAGGPVVHPEVDAILLTPIAPHMLTNRPVVVPGASLVRVEPLVDGSSEDVYVTFDGQSGHGLQEKDVIEIRPAQRPLRLVRAGKRTYFDVLRQKLKWGER